MNLKTTLSLICITFISFITFSQEEGIGNENNKILPNENLTINSLVSGGQQRQENQ